MSVDGGSPGMRRGGAWKVGARKVESGDPLCIEKEP